MRVSTDLDFTDMLKDPLPAGTYILEYERDGFSNSNNIIDIHCKMMDFTE